jgi:hypothetical protein
MQEAVEDTVDGVPARRYQLRVDLVRVAEAVTDEARKKSLRASLQAGIRTLDTLIWLDEHDRVLRGPCGK